MRTSARLGWVLLAGALAAPQARAFTAVVEFSASDFLGRVAGGVTGEPVPDDDVAGTFIIESAEVPAPVDHTDWYLTPAASDLEIAGYGYPPEGVQAYVGFSNGVIDMIQIGGTNRYQNDPNTGPVVHVVTLGTDDFSLGMSFDLAGNLLPITHRDASGMTHDAWFGYATSTRGSYFQPYVLAITVTIDGGTPQHIAAADTLPDASVCWDAIVNGDPFDEDGGGLMAGDLHCAPPASFWGNTADESASERAAGGVASLRDVKLGKGTKRARAAGATAQVKTALGTLELATKPVDRLLCNATAGVSSVVSAPAAIHALGCAKARIAPGGGRFRPVRNVLVSGERYHVGAPTRLCTDPTGSGADVLCYRARRAKGKSAQSEVWVAHAFATESLLVGRAREICLPAEAAGRSPEMPPR